jgi:hypothetical protein
VDPSFSGRIGGFPAGFGAANRSFDGARRCDAPLPMKLGEEMLDAIFLAIGFGFLVVAVLYALACDHL